MLKQQLEKKFTEEYNRLNKQQQKAVDKLDGPVMVIAGPGTGKTQILSARIAKILMETDAQPQNILCLTYTDAGAVAMRKRLLGFIGADAYKVSLYTFHAFCNDVIQDNLSLFEKNSLDAISELERIEFLKQLIDGFDKTNPLKRYRGDVYYETKNLHNLFSNMKKEGWSPAFINSKIDEYLNSLPQRDDYIAKRATKDFKKGDVRTDKIAVETQEMEKLRAAVNQFEKYQQLMRANNRYDFDDMINWVIKAFEKNPALLQQYQEQHQYILVDEYQDTSGTQNRLVELLINYWEVPNIFVVGDDDQSIYRFQGANVENMESFASRYVNDLLTVVLTSNYRSTQPILNVSKTLIDNNEERLVKKISGLSKELVAANININNLTHTPVLKECETERQEMIDIVLQLQLLLQQGVQPGRIGVIYKENKYGETLAQYCKLRNIPVYTKRSVNALNEVLAQQIILLLQYLCAEHDIAYSGDEMLFEILHFNWFNIPPIEIAKISIEVSTKNYGEGKTSIRQRLKEIATQPVKDLFSAPVLPGIQIAHTAIESLIADVANTTLQTLFENIIRKTGLLGVIMQSADKVWHMELLTALFDFVKEETRRNPNLHLRQLINIIDLMQHEKLLLPVIQVSGNDKGINLMTAHGSKGLEFEYVFFVGCNASNWEKKRKPAANFSMPDTMFNTLGKQSDEEELRRLFYVALTRAEKHLYISYSKYKNDGKPLEPSMFIAEIKAAHALPVVNVLINEAVLTEFAILQFSGQQKPEIAQLEKNLVTRLLEKFMMNVTALNNYLKCPLAFYYQNLVRVPSGKNEATEFGSAVHYALEKLFQKMQQSGGVKFPLLNEFVNDFEWYMGRHRESFTREQYARRIEYGQTILADYYSRYIQHWNKVVAIERNIRGVVVEGVPLKGKLDKLEFEGNFANVVDYKTGDFDKAKPKMEGPDAKHPHGGDYWRQAVFYKILVDNYDQKNWQVVSTEFDFIEPEKQKNYHKQKIVIQPQDITTVKEQIKNVWQKIQAHDFYTGCGKQDCNWCNFVKTNNLAVILHEDENA
jgi:DNA helicase II / ATP-dependent DNA helicase PcrA